MAFTFPGITKYIDEAADAAGLVARDGDDDQRRSDVNIHRGKARTGPLLKTIVDALGQLPGIAERAESGLIDPESAKDSLARIKLARDTLAVQLAGLDAAIADSVANLGLGDGPEVKGARKAKPRS